MAFVHLHVHSQYSLLDGTMDPKLIVANAAKFGMSSVALTDSGNMFGAVAFYKDCKAKNIHPVFGAELNLQPEGVGFVDTVNDVGQTSFQMLALVENEVGYKNLCELLTFGIVKGMRYKPRIDYTQLEKFKEGLIFLTGGRKGAFGRPLLKFGVEKARAEFQALHERLGADQLYIELQDIGLPDDEAVNVLARELSATTGRQLVVTNAVHYGTAEDCTIHEALNAIAYGASLAHPKRIQVPTDQAYFKSEAEMRELFPEDGEALDRTVEIADRCHFKFTLGVYHFPAAVPPDPAKDADTDANWAFFYRAFPPPLDYGLPDPALGIPERPIGSGSLNGYFEWYAKRGLELRLRDVDPAKYQEYYDRLNFELELIERMEFPAYLLIVAEFINWSKDNLIPVGPGRGSAAGSLAAYAMRITDIDPIQFDLLFERFLNPERVSMPDIDVDFCQDRREEAIEHVRVKYGAPLVSQIITYGKLKAKAAVRDISRILDLTFSEADEVAKLIPETLDITLGKALEQEERLVRRRDGDVKVRRVMLIAQAVEGMCRQTGVHAAGVVIADRPLVEYAPLYVDAPDSIPAVQFDMKSAESIGLIKFDFLGLKTLDQIRDAVAAIKENRGITIDMARIPIDDAATYEILQRGDAFGIFQLESSGMRELLSRLKPTCLDDLVALVALYRPGPLKSGMVDDFVDRKHGRKQVEYPHPSLEGILKPTYGTIVYQEQVMQAAQIMAGFSLGGADLLRRAMGKKDKVEMARQKQLFVEGSIKNNIDGQRATEIFDLLEKFAEYGFNKSHSAAYGYISYQTAYLKANYRAEYMAALMSIDAGDTDKVFSYIEDCRSAGIRIEPVSVNHSARAFRAESPTKDAPKGIIRYGLAAVKGVGEGAIEAIVEGRKAAGGQFRDALHFFETVDLKRINKKTIEGLVMAGAFDFTKVPRAAMLHRIGQTSGNSEDEESASKEPDAMERAMALALRTQADKAAGQASLFGGLAAKAQPQFRFPNVPEWPTSQKLAFEKKVLGLYLTGHPMQAHERDVTRLLSTRIDKLNEVRGDKDVTVLGLPVDVRIVRTKRGDKMAFVKLEDQYGSVECIFFGEPWLRSQRAINATQVVLVTGRPEAGGEGVKIRANTAELLSEIRLRNTNEVQISLNTEDLAGDKLEQFHRLLRDHKGTCKSRLLLRAADVQLELEMPLLPVDAGAADFEEEINLLFGRPELVEYK